MQADDYELARLEGNTINSTYGNRGMTFEHLIEYANGYYRRSGAAIIEKQHTLCKPLRNAAGKIVSAKYEIKATVDFMGRYGEKPIAFEAKHCAADTIELKRVEDHQCQFLRDWTATAGAIGFVIVSFRLQDFYIIPWDYWQEAITAREKHKGSILMLEPVNTVWQTTGKASIRKDELPKEWSVQTGSSAALDYLAVVKRLWQLKG